ncbi:MAG TPA: alpha/beta hydrolase [Casimicrobiaceae bacterium]|nr:alpha/beta hydrolase [Casimicrobiaceae bacterium]
MNGWLLRRTAAGLVRLAPARSLAFAALCVMAFGACVVLAPEPTSAVSLRRLTVNGAEHTYVEQGTGDAVVFLHGSATDYRVFDELRRHFGRDFRFVAYSRRHHAPNAWPDDGDTYRMTQHAEDLVALIRALGIERAHVVAVSMGARVAAHAAVHHADVVKTLTLSDGLLASPGSDEGKRVLADVGPAFNAIFAHLRAGDDAAAVAAYVEMAKPDGGWNALSSAWQSYYRDNARTLGLAARDPTLRPPSCDALRAIRVPVLVIAGDQTAPAFKVTNDELLRCLAPGAEYALVPRSAHYWYVDNPGDAARLLHAFLRKHRSR